MPKQDSEDADRTKHILACYDALSPEDKAVIMDLDKRLEKKKYRGMGRIIRLEVLWAIGALEVLYKAGRMLEGR